MSPEGAPERAQRVLVIDDEEQIRRALKSVLQARHYEVDLAETAEEGLELTATRTPDIIVLDLTLPGMSGLEACRRLREWYHGPILILSVRNADDDKIAALDLGADDYLTKPFSTGELLARIRALLRRTQGADASVTGGALGRPVHRLRQAHGHGQGRAGPPHAHRVRHPRRARAQRRTRRHLADAARIRSGGPSTWATRRRCGCTSRTCAARSSRRATCSRYILTEPGVGFRFVEPDEL